MRIKIYCVFHIDEDDKPIFLAGFSDIAEAHDYMIDRDGFGYNFAVQTTFCDVPTETDSY